MKKLFLVVATLAALAALSIFAPVATAQDVLVQYTGTNVPIINNIALQNFSTGSAGALRYYYFNVPPQAAVTFYVTNNSSSTTHALTITTLYSGLPNTPSPGTNTSAWVPLQTTILASGGAGGVGHQGTSQALSIAHNATAVAGTSITSAAYVAINISLADVSTDTFSLYAVATPNGGTGIQQVQGTQPAGVAATSNPLTAGCVGDVSSQPTAAGINLYLPCDNSFASGYGLLIGHEVSSAQGQTLGTWQRCQWGSNGLCDPLTVSLFAPNASGTQEAVGISNGNATQGSLLVTQGGQFISHTQTYTSNVTTTLQNFNQGTAGIMLGCSVIVNVAGPVTGTSPTLNIIFQDSDGTSGIFQDRISFTQFTTTGIQRAVIWAAPNTGIVPYVPSQGTLAAGTIVNGPVLPTTRAFVTVGGTTPSFGAVSIFQNCW